MRRKKILLLGDFGVGKTSLIRRYVDNSFSDNYLTTIGVKISRKKITVDSKDIELLIWDIEGATDERDISTTYMKGASGAIFVADLTRVSTIENLHHHIDRYKMINIDSPYIVAYNKFDLIGTEEMLMYKLPLEGYKTSAKSDFNVETIFLELAKRIY